MSEARGQAEPSMEEILASIRRIISQESQQATNGMPRNETTVSAPAEGASAAADVLLLTEMVAEDGSVVSLAEARAAAAGRLTTPVSHHPAEPAPVAPAADTAASPTGTFGAMAQPGVAAAAAEPESPQAALHDQPVGSPVVTIETEKKDTLVSQESRAAAAAAFAELTRHVSREREAAIGGGRTVEDLVREALDPMLKNWLDTHLPSMVERVVRQEIQRVVRQADDVA